jgi:hypothetical protein
MTLKEFKHCSAIIHRNPRASSRANSFGRNVRFTPSGISGSGHANDGQRQKPSSDALAKRHPSLRSRILPAGSWESAQSRTAQCALRDRRKDRSECAERYDLFHSAKT